MLGHENMTAAYARVQVSTNCDGDDGRALAQPVAGYLFAILSAFLSGFAAVYTEFVMKARDDSLYWQNLQLYGFGAVFNAAALSLSDMADGTRGVQLGDKHVNNYCNMRIRLLCLTHVLILSVVHIAFVRC
jgi:hypothetical protein